MHSRNFGLDLVRALAILMVLLAHGRALLPESWDRKWFAIGGYFGVELFFVLSGLLVGGILLRLFDQAESEANRCMHSLIRGFWIRRWFRTLPNYFLFLTLNFTLFRWLFGPLEGDWRYFLFLQNLAWNSPKLMAESWSLAIEEWFYLSLPLVFALFISLSISHRRALLIATIFYIVFFTLVRLFWSMDGSLQWGPDVRRVVIVRLDSIGYGVLIAFLTHFHSNAVNSRKGLLAASGAILTAYSLYLYIEGVLIGPAEWRHRTWMFSITGAGLALLLPWFAGLKCHRKIILSSVTFVSLTSYSMYLIHFSFSIRMAQDMIAPLVGGWIFPYLSYLAITTLLAALVYYFFEQPMTEVRERFSPRRQRS